MRSNGNIIGAALKWWENKRPDGWSMEKHTKNWRVNLDGSEAEAWLACECAAWKRSFRHKREEKRDEPRR